MKVKTFTIEVVRTDIVKVTIPESYLDEEFQKDWESDLWPLDGITPEEKARDIAKYVALMSLVAPYGSHDGIGRIFTSPYEKPDYSKDMYATIAIEDWEMETGSEILRETGWEDSNV